MNQLLLTHQPKRPTQRELAHKAVRTLLSARTTHQRGYRQPVHGSGFKRKSKGSRDAMVTVFVARQRAIHYTATFAFSPIPKFKPDTITTLVGPLYVTPVTLRSSASYRGARRNAARKLKRAA